MINKPYSESCEQNREPILAVLSEAFADRSRLLEIGSGTGQHAVYFGAELPHLRWQTADVLPHHAGIRPGSRKRPCTMCCRRWNST